MTQSGIICLGEALIDFIPTDLTNSRYYKSPGGAPANVAVGLARLGIKASFIGKVGDDSLGRFLNETIENYGVDTKQLTFTKKAKTGITFVTNDRLGERSFEFFIDPSADRYLEWSDIHQSHFTSHRIFHFGSISMITNPAKETTKLTVKLAKKNNMLISYDPNLRLRLWDSPTIAHKTITSMFNDVDILKLSEEELEFVTGETSIIKGIKKLRTYEIPLVVITLGQKGCYISIKNEFKHIPAIQIKAVDTTGAGDGFVAGLLYSIHNTNKRLNEIEFQDIIKMMQFAVITGGLTTSKKGAMTSLPTLNDIKNHLVRDK